jgi:acetylglutamate kinase
LIADATVAGGMIPKVETCLAAIEAGVGAAQILDGRLAHVLILEIFTEAGVGTKIHEF